MSFRFRIVVAIALCLAVAGCLQITKPIHSVAPAGQTASRSVAAATEDMSGLPRLKTSVEVSERSIVTGSFTPIVLSITNLGREPVTLGFGATCQLLFVVYDRHGTQVSPTWTCGFMPTTLTLEAGETVSQTDGWLAATYDHSQGPYGTDVPLPPGPYRIQAYVSEHGYLSAPRVVRLVGERSSGGS